MDGNAHTDEGLRSCAKGYMDAATKADVTVDRVPLPNLITRYRFATPAFTFRYPADNVLSAVVPRPGTSKAAGDGTFVMLAPLAAGRHTITLFGLVQGVGL